MGTRCYIGRLKADGSVEAFYVQLNGMPSETGKTLKRSYRTAAQIDALFRRGSIDWLADTPEESPLNRWTPGEVDGFTDPKHYLDSMGVMIAFVYLHDGHKWQVSNNPHGKSASFKDLR